MLTPLVVSSRPTSQLAAAPTLSRSAVSQDRPEPPNEPPSRPAARPAPNVVVGGFAPLPVRRRRAPGGPCSTSGGLAFDLFAELDDNRGAYQGGADVTIYAVPRYLEATISALAERVVALVPTLTRPGDSTLTCMLVKRGCELIAGDERVRALVGAKARFHGLGEEVSDDEVNELVGYVSRFEVSIPDLSGAGVIPKRNLRMPESIKSSMMALASDLGASSSEVCKIAIIAGLREQADADDALGVRNLDALDAALTIFAKRVKVRGKCIEAILTSLEEE